MLGKQYGYSEGWSDYTIVFKVMERTLCVSPLDNNWDYLDGICWKWEVC